MFSAGLEYRKYSSRVLVLFTLQCRAEVADRVGDLFFLVPDQAIIFSAPLFDRKAAGERHPYRVAGLFENEHREGGDQVIEERFFGFRK